MKSVFILALAVAVTGCAQTRFYEQGQLVAAIQADARNITIRTANGSSFHADELNHSAPTEAAGKAYGSVINGAIGAAVTGMALLK